MTGRRLGRAVLAVLFWGGVVRAERDWAASELPRASNPRELGLNFRLLTGGDLGPRNGSVQPKFVLGVVADLISSADRASLGWGPVVELRTIAFRQWDADLGASAFAPLCLDESGGLGLSAGLGIRTLGLQRLGYGFGRISILLQGTSSRGFNYVFKSAAFVRVQTSLTAPEQIGVTVGIELGGGLLLGFLAHWYGPR